MIPTTSPALRFSDSQNHVFSSPGPKCGLQHSNPAVVGRKSGLHKLADDEYCTALPEFTCLQDEWLRTLCRINLKRILIVQPEPGPLLKACTHYSKKH
jgi:hypothetical protein